MREITELNNMTWRAPDNEIEQWRRAIDPNTNILEEKAKFGFSIMNNLTGFAVQNQTPLKLDY